MQRQFSENGQLRLGCRRHPGPDYLALLQLFLNHRRFLRSERPERVGKSPAELLTGEDTLTGWKCSATPNTVQLIFP